jgi:branched-chain amino acid transport system substrate-binding protein
MLKTVLASCLAMSVVAVQPVALRADELDNHVIKIAVLSDFSSQFSFYTGKYSLQAIQMAVDDFRTKKPNRKIEVVSGDHQNKPDIGASLARKWFDLDGVDTIADMPTSGVTLAVIPIATERKKVLLASTANSMRITNELCNGLTVRFGADSHVNNTGVRALLGQGVDTWYFVSWDNASGADAEKDATQIITAAGGKVIGGVRFPLGAADMSSFILQAKASGAKGIAIGAGGGDLVNAVKAAAEFGVLGKQTVVGLSMSLSDVNSLGLQTAQGMYYSDGFYWDRTAETRAFAKRYFDMNGGTKMPDNVAMSNYSAVTHYLEAVDAVGTVESGAVMNEMRKRPVRDIYTQTGTLREDGQMVHETYLLQVKTPAESKAPWDYLKVVATIPPEQAYLPLSASTCPLVKKSSGG